MALSKHTHVQMSHFFAACPRDDIPAPNRSSRTITSLKRRPISFEVRHSTHITCALKANERRTVPLAFELRIGREEFRRTGASNVIIVISTVTGNSSMDQRKLLDHNICLQTDDKIAPVAVFSKGSHDIGHDPNWAHFSISNDKIKGGRKPHKKKGGETKKAKLAEVVDRSRFEVVSGMSITYDHPHQTTLDQATADDISKLGPQHGFKLCVQLLLKMENEWVVSDHIFVSPNRIIEYQGNLEINEAILTPQLNPSANDWQMAACIFFSAPWLSIEKQFSSGQDLKDQGAALLLTLCYVDKNTKAQKEHCGSFTSTPGSPSPLTIKSFFKNSVRCTFRFCQNGFGPNFERITERLAETANEENLQVTVQVVAAEGPFNNGNEPLCDPLNVEFTMHPRCGLSQVKRSNPSGREEIGFVQATFPPGFKRPAEIKHEPVAYEPSGAKRSCPPETYYESSLTGHQRLVHHNLQQQILYNIDDSGAWHQLVPAQETIQPPSSGLAPPFNLDDLFGSLSPDDQRQQIADIAEELRSPSSETPPDKTENPPK